MASSNITSSRNSVRVGGAVVAATDIQQIEPSMRWQTIVSTFIASQDCKQSSRDLYSRTLSQFFLWVSESGKDMSKMQRRDILEYKDFLLTDKSNLTAASYIVIVRKFYEWAEACKLYPNIAKGIKTPPKKQAFKKQHLSDNKSAELIAMQSSKVVEHHVRRSKQNPDGGIIVEECPTNLRDVAIVNLMLRCGLRCIEVARAKVEDICFKDERRVLKVWGKGKDGKDDFVVLTDKAWLPIKTYLASRGAVKGGEYLFVSASDRCKGEGLTTRTISGICKKGLVEVGLDGREYTAHSLRHTTAVAILKHGGSITDVQDVLRHASPVTSQIYTESIKEEMRLQKAPETMLDNAF